MGGETDTPAAGAQTEFQDEILSVLAAPPRGCQMFSWLDGDLLKGGSPTVIGEYKLPCTSA